MTSLAETDTAAGARTSAGPAGQASPTIAQEAFSSPVATESSTPSSRATAPATPPPTDPIAVPCDDRAAFVGDVTIRDNSVMPAGEPFVKTWRLQNAGTCGWSEDYSLVFFGGERMGAPDSLPLPSPVPPGATVDLSVDLVAPLDPGTFQGFWRLSNSAGTLFGIGPNGEESFWVKIIVEMVPPTSASESSPTAPPIVYAMGTLQLAESDGADLDTGALNPGQGVDLTLRSVSLGALELAPRSSALVGAPGTEGISGPSGCLAASFSAAAVPANTLDPGSSLCYLTDEGRPGLLVVNSRDETLGFSFTTWAP